MILAAASAATGISVGRPLRAVFYCALGLAPLVLFGLQSGSYDTPRWLAIYVLAGAATCYGAWRAYVSREVKIGWPEIALVLVVGWLSVTLLWSPLPLIAATKILNVAVLGVVALAVRHIRILPIANSVVAAVIISGVVLLALGDQFVGGFGNKNFYTEFLLIAAPFFLVFGRKVAVVAISVVGAYLLLGNGSHIEWVVGPASLVFWINRRYGGVWAAIFAFIAIDAVVLWRPAALVLPFKERLELTYNTLVMWLDAPLFGHGFGALNYLYPLYQERHLAILPGETVIDSSATLPGQAHNEYVQILAETGLVGAALFAGVVVLAVAGYLAHTRKQPYYIRARGPGDPLVVPAGLSLLVAAVCATMNFPLQLPATAFLIAVSLGIVLRSLPSMTVRLGRVRYAGLVVSLVVLVGLGYSGAKLFQSAAYLAASKQIGMANPPQGFLMAARAHNLWPLSVVVRQQLFVAFMRWHENPYAMVGDKKVRFVFGKGLKKWVYQTALSGSPYLPSVGINRIALWTADGLLEERKDDADAIFTRLKSTASMQTMVWVADATFAINIGDLERASLSLSRARRTEQAPNHIAKIDELDRIIGGLT